MNIKNVKCIGISGLARSGKDSFCKALIPKLKLMGVKSSRVAFADKLKKNIDGWLMINLGYSAYTTDDREKKIIRPMLVAYGEAARMVHPDYWIMSVHDTVTTLKSVGIVPIITDVRYINELEYVKNNGGIVINVEKHGNLPPNKEEQENEQILKESADFRFSWHELGDEINTKGYEMVNSFIDQNFVQS